MEQKLIMVQSHVEEEKTVLEEESKQGHKQQKIKKVEQPQMEIDIQYKEEYQKKMVKQISMEDTKIQEVKKILQKLVKIQ